MKPAENSEKQVDFPCTELGTCTTIPAMKKPEISPETDVWPHCVDTSAHSPLPAIDWNAACARLRVHQRRDVAVRAATLSAECGDERFGCQSSPEGGKAAVREDMAVGTVNTEGDFGMGGGVMGMMRRFALMAGLHMLADYPLQGDFLAKAKNRRSPIPSVPWWQALGAHSIIHGLFVGIVTRRLSLGIAETLVHAWTDDAKCRGRLTYNQDQAIHLTCKVIWAVISKKRASL